MRLRILVAAAAAILASGTAADAVTIGVSSGGLGNAQAFESAFWGSASRTTESFENPVVGSYGILNPIVSGVGSFSQVAAGSGGACEPACDGLAILNEGVSPFSGRFATDGRQWLDSNDSVRMRWMAGPFGPVSRLGFFITDPNDVGALMKITTTDGGTAEVTFANIFGGSQSSGRVFYVTVVDESGSGLASLLFDTNGARDDGFGIDEFSVAVPEPATLGLLGAGLVGLGLIRRRQAKS